MPKINHEEYVVLKELDGKWKWIARDEDKSLWVFAEKPFRKSGDISSSCWDTETGRSYPVLELIDEIHLFQFVQWEDAEPYEIAELIEEYEEHEFVKINQDGRERLDKLFGKESEETEVKKDLEWLLDYVEAEYDKVEEKEEDHPLDLYYTGKQEALREVFGKINQLDEPEVLSQEFINEKAVEVYADTTDAEVHAVFRMRDLQNLLVPTLSKMETVEITEERVMEWLDNNDFYDHRTAETVLANAVDKGELGYYGTKYSVVEKPVIPKFVADWIESRDYYNVYKVLQDLSAPGSPHASKDVRNWIFHNQENVEKFVRTWLDGFTVEEEQKYILSINITDKASKTNYETFLNKRGIFHSMENDSFNSEEFNWTEEEIKNLESGEILFEHFAVKVEELEE